MDDRILIVDDEPPIISLMQRVIGAEFAVTAAHSGAEALDVIQRTGPFAVVVSDMRMPGMSGLELLSRIRVECPDTVRLMCSGDGDLHTAVTAVNEGAVFRFLTKPYTADVLRSTIRSSVEQHRLITAERTLLERTLNELTQVLTDVLGLVNPSPATVRLRVRPCAVHIAKAVAPQMTWQVDLASMLSQLGCLTLAPELLQDAYSGKALAPLEQERVASHPQIAHDLLVRIPRLEVVAAIVLNQGRQRYVTDEERAPIETRRPAVLGSQIVRVALEFDRLLLQGVGRSQARAALAKRTEEFDPALVRALESFSATASVCDVKRLVFNQLDVGMVLEEDLRTHGGVLVAPKGYTITLPMIHRLRDGQHTGNLPGDVLVSVYRPRAV